MRRFWAIVLAFGVIFGVFGLTACTKETRDEYTMTLVYEPSTRTLSGEMQAKLCNRTESVWETLKFQLWANAFREGAKYLPVSSAYAPAAYYEGASFGNITVTSVRGGEFCVAGEDENILFVTPPEPVYPDEIAEICVRFTVTLARIEHRLGVGRNTVNLSGFYPVLCAIGNEGFCEYIYAPYGDPFVSEVADYDVTFTLPKSYEVAHTGVGTRTEEGERAIYRIRAENVRDFAMVCSERFEVLSDTSEGIPVSYYYVKDDDPSRTLSVAVQSIRFYAQTFGDYAYPTYTVVETGFAYGGMEYPMLSLIADDLSEREKVFAVAHETAHQWWYAMVGSNQFCEAWQDEGLAEYSTALFVNAYPEYGVTYEDCIRESERAYRAFYSVQSQLTKGDTAMRRDLTEFTGDYAYRSLVYDKSVIMYDRLRQTMGDRRFFASIKEYARACEGKIASPALLIACFSERVAQAEGIFASFLDGSCVI